MKTRLIIGIIVVVIVVIVAVVLVNLVTKTLSLPFTTPKATATIDGHTFHITVVKTEKDQEIGLSNRSSLPKNEGMLFPFPKPDYYAFWMRNMKFPIDIIYIANKKIVTIYSDVAAPTNSNVPLIIYKPNQPADTVLEINAGLVSQYHFKTGDSVSTSL